MTTPVVALIVNFNSGALLERALDGLDGQAVSEILVVDNASHDLSWQAALGRPGAGLERLGPEVRLERLGPEVRLERLENNVGFAAAVNHGLARTKAPYVLLLNADVDLDDGYVASLADALDGDPGLAAATGTLVLPDGLVDSTGISISTARWATDRDRGATPQENSPEEAGTPERAEPFGVSGAAGLFRRSAVEPAGGLWEDLFVYWEDTELAWRLRLGGWRFALVPGARAVHQRGSDSADPTFVEAANFGNRLATVARHEGLRGLLRPSTLAVTLVTGSRLAVRHRRALRTSRPWKSVRSGLSARRSDREEARPDRPGRAPLPFESHPWAAWLSAQFSGGKRGLGAVQSP